MELVRSNAERYYYLFRVKEISYLFIIVIFFLNTSPDNSSADLYSNLQRFTFLTT